MSIETSALEKFRARARNTNVNDVTLLATDYLNHFNEALMLAELVVDMPDMLEDFATWAPRSYSDHFRASGIADRELAIEAYEFSPPEYKEPFEKTMRRLDIEILSLQDELRLSADIPDDADAGECTAERCLVIRELIDHAGAIINGQLCDDLQSSPKGEEEATLDQEEINAMFG